MTDKYFKDLPVIAIHLEQGIKDAITAISKEKGMQVATYCRLLIINHIKEYAKENNDK